MRETTRRRLAGSLLATSLLLPIGCGGSGSGGGGSSGPGVTPPPPLPESRRYRAIAGVSMGAYGAMNLGTKHPDLFVPIASLGGPVDMKALIRHIVLDNLEVKPQSTIPRNVYDDFTFDHLPPYPGRDTRIDMVRDLFIAFGNPVLHHPQATAQYLATLSQPAQIGFDDRWGQFMVMTGPRSFLDGGDTNDDGLRQVGEIPDEPTDVLLLASQTLSQLTMLPGIDVGMRTLADIGNDGIYDVGDGIVVDLSEPITNDNGNLVYEPALGETYDDFGLDGVAGTGDYGEGNGTFDYDPDRAHWLAEDPITRLASRSKTQIANQWMYMDVGTKDQFGFEQHYAHLALVLQNKGLAVTEQSGFSGDCISVPHPTDDYLLIRYDGGHIGIPSADDITNQLLNGTPCGSLIVWQRLLTMIGWLDQHFPAGVMGAQGLRLSGDFELRALPSPALTVAGQPTEMRTVGIYRPPAHFNGTDRLPIVYFLGGYGQDPADYARIQLLLDTLIVSRQIQNMYFVFLPGDGGFEGSFYVNHVVPHDQVPTLPPGTGRYEDSIIQDLIPQVERQVLTGRIAAR